MNGLSSISFPALGTTAALFVVDPRSLAASRAVLEQELEAIDRSCSRFRSDSELSRLNAAAGHWVKVSDGFLAALQVGLRAARLTDGAVDPTVGRAMRAIGYDRDFASISAKRTSGAVVPGWQTIQVDGSSGTVRLPLGVELDLGATAKALAADRAADRIGKELKAGVLVNLGGDIATAGTPPPGGWRVTIGDDHRDRASARRGDDQHPRRGPRDLEHHRPPVALGPGTASPHRRSAARHQRRSRLAHGQRRRRLLRRRQHGEHGSHRPRR